MSKVVARGHGGDAGGDPPRQPNKVPTSCEASSKQKKKRGMSRSQNLDVAFEANGRNPLPIEFDIKLDTYKPVGPNGTKFIRFLGNMIGLRIPPYYRSWNHVPSEFKTSLMRRLRELFILDPNVPEWPQIVTGIERDCQDLFKGRKSRLKTHFENVGGYKNVANARRNPPRHVDLKTWDKTVNLFLDSKFQKRSKTNSANRKHVRYSSLHGSSSYAASQYKKKDPETQEPQGSIANFYDMHHRPSGWVNDLAKADHEAMLAEQAAQMQQHGSSSSGSTSSSTALKEKEIVTKVLGERRGHNPGIGRKLKRPAFSALFGPPTPPPPPPPPHPDVMKNFVDAITALVQHNQQMYNTPPGGQFPPPPVIDIQALIAPLIPGQPSQPPQPPSHPPSQPPSQPDSDDEDTMSDSSAI